MSSPPPIVPLEPYFNVSSNLMAVVSDVYELVGDAIQDRQYIYHRGAFYSDLADVLELFVEAELEPFADSLDAWAWWIGQLRIRAEQLGDDKVYAMMLPPPRDADWRAFGDISNQVDEVIPFMMTVYAQEEDDFSTSYVQGKITTAECVKICARFARYILPKYCYSIEKPTPQHPGLRVTWKWAKAVADELTKLYRQMGEPDVAGGWGPGGGEIPPISWPEP